MGKNAAQGRAGLWPVGDKQLHCASLVSFGFYYSHLFHDCAAADGHDCILFDFN